MSSCAQRRICGPDARFGWATEILRCAQDDIGGAQDDKGWWMLTNLDG